MRDGGGGRGVVFCVVLGEFAEVEVVATVFDLSCAFKGGIRGDKDSEAGREGKGFLHSGEEDVDAEVIEADGHGGE